MTAWWWLLRPQNYLSLLLQSSVFSHSILPAPCINCVGSNGDASEDEDGGKDLVYKTSRGSNRGLQLQHHRAFIVHRCSSSLASCSSKYCCLCVPLRSVRMWCVFLSLELPLERERYHSISLCTALCMFSARINSSDFSLLNSRSCTDSFSSVFLWADVMCDF
jgi:hypothetical protein